MENLGSQVLIIKVWEERAGRGMCSYSWYGSVLLFTDIWEFGSIWRVRIWSDLGSILDDLEPLSWILVQLPGLNDPIEAAPTTSEQPDFTCMLDLPNNPLDYVHS